MVRKIEKEDRLERIAKSKRKFWAREILLQELWKKVKERGEMKKWATDLITMETEKVLKCRIILTNHIIGNCIEEVMKKERVKKSEDMMKKSRNKEAERLDRLERIGYLKQKFTKRKREVDDSKDNEEMKIEGKEVYNKIVKKENAPSAQPKETSRRGGHPRQKQ